MTTTIRQEHTRTEVKSTICYMCACRCGINVTLRDGAVRYIEGNPNHPLNQGVICAKGASGIMKQYSPARLTQPLRRKADSERRARRFLFGEHGRRDDLHHRRFVLGIRRP